MKYQASSNSKQSSAASTYWHEPDAGLAQRAPPTKQAKTARGHTFFGDVVVYHESELEHRVSTILSAYCDIVEIHSQYPKVEYVDADGVLRAHTFDFFIVTRDGTRIAIAVKQARKKAAMEDLMGRIVANGITAIEKDGTLVPSIADAVFVATNLEASFACFESATAIIASRPHHDDAECAVLAKIVQRMPGRFRFGQLLLNAPTPFKRRTAIWRLIDLRLIEPIVDGRIDELSWLCVSRPAFPHDSNNQLKGLQHG